MEENQPETQKPPEKQASGPALFVAIFIVVYFFLPVIFVYPFFLVYGNSPPRQVVTSVRMGLYPVFKLAEAMPVYENFLKWEFDLVGIR